MGYFAVLKSGESDGVRGWCCHVNYWSLPSLIPGRRLFYFDVGVELENSGGAPIEKFQLALPFSVEEAKWSDKTSAAFDLFDDFADPQVAELIFGGPVTQNGQQDARILSLAYGEDFRVERIDGARVAAVGIQRSDSSVYEVPLLRPLQPGERCYYRTRWRIFGAQPLWRWKRLSGGARMDFRMADVRESSHANVERQLRSRIIGIAGVNFFLMASPRLRLHASSPPVKSMRILEPHAWKPYLRSAARSGGSGGLLVYHWRQGAREASPAQPIDVDNPFKVLADFDRQGSTAWWVQMTRTVLSVIIALIAIGYGDNVAAVLGEVDINLRLVLTLLGVSSLIAAGTLISKLRVWAAGKFRGPRAGLRGVERRVLGVWPH